MTQRPRTAISAARTQCAPILPVATEAVRRLDEAIAAYQRALPDHGLKLIVPPPLPDGRRGHPALSSWRRGEISAPVHRAASAGEALSLLFAAQAARDRLASVQAGCARCRGVGWTIAPAGIRVMCPHPEGKG
jgi:hypothetical protein